MLLPGGKQRGTHAPTDKGGDAQREDAAPSEVPQLKTPTHAAVTVSPRPRHYRCSPDRTMTSSAPPPAAVCSACTRSIWKTRTSPPFLRHAAATRERTRLAVLPFARQFEFCKSDLLKRTRVHASFSRACRRVAKKPRASHAAVALACQEPARLGPEVSRALAGDVPSQAQVAQHR